LRQVDETHRAEPLVPDPRTCAVQTELFNRNKSSRFDCTLAEVIQAVGKILPFQAYKRINTS